MSEESPLAKYLSIFPQTPEERVLRLLVQLGIRIANADEGSLLVFDETSNELVFAMTVGNSQSESSLKGQRVAIGSGITGLAALTREVHIGAPTFHEINQPDNVSGDPKSVLAAPMLIDDVLVGVMTAVTFKPEVRFGGREADLYAGFAAVAGVIVQQRRRLAMLESESDASINTGTLSERARAERDIFQSLERMLRTRPDSLTTVASLLAGIERLAVPGSH